MNRLHSKDLREHGFALIAVLWMAALLSVIVLGYAATARLKGEQALNEKVVLKKRSLVESALNIARFEYTKYEINKRMLLRKEELEDQTGQKLDLWYPRYEPHPVSFDTSVLTGTDVSEWAVTVTAECGRLNVNKLGMGALQEILKACGVGEEESIGTAGAVRDWIDSDDAHHIEGAENEYYLSLEEPYLCKNAPIETVEELLLVKGITREVFYGNEEHPGLVDFFTVVGTEKTMDINNASPRSFEIIESFTKEGAKAIVDLRAEQPISHIGDAAEFLTAEEYSALRNYYRIHEPTYVTIKAAKMLRDGTPGKAVSMTYTVKKPEKENKRR